MMRWAAVFALLQQRLLHVWQGGRGGGGGGCVVVVVVVGGGGGGGGRCDVLGGRVVRVCAGKCKGAGRGRAGQMLGDTRC